MSAPAFTYASPADRPALTRLWKRVFGDSDAYLSLFFTHRFIPEQTLLARLSPHPDPVAMLFLLPISFWSGQKRTEGRYLYAVATDPDFRSRGLSTLLLEEAHRRLLDEGLAFSVLVPAEPSLFDFYASRGFHTEFFRCAQRIAPDPGLGQALSLCPASLEQLARLRDGLFQGSRLYGRWDADALAYQQRETELLGGETLLFSVNGQEGYAVCHPTEELVLIKEWGFPAPDEAVFSAIARRYGRKALWLDLPAAPGERDARPFAMTYWYHNERKREDGTAPVLSLVLD